MSKHVLVAYGTRAESTHEVAEFVGEVLRYHSMIVDVRPVKQVQDLTPYDALVLGSAIRIGHVLPEVLKFAHKHQSELQHMPVAYFVVCATMKENTSENRQVVNGYLESLRNFKEPISQGMFAGRIKYDLLKFPLNYFMKFAKDEELLAEGDFREWGTIRSWAREVSHEFLELVKA